MLNRTAHILARAQAALAVSVLAAALLFGPTDAAADDVSGFRPGDIIFQTTDDGQSLAILLASKSRYTHVGIIDVDDAGRMVVLEAISTTRETPLQDWIDRGIGQRIAVYRLDGLTEPQAKAVTQAARTHFGKAYDPFFFASEDQLYCSELVHVAFRDGIDLRLGAWQQIGSLDIDNSAARGLIEQRWNSYPLCRDGQVGDVDACMTVLREQHLITPQALADDDRVRLIYTNYAP